MKITNLYHNPNHIFTTTSDGCPLFVRNNMSATFEEDKIHIQTLIKGASHIAFGGCGGRVIRLGLEAGETYTASLRVHLDSVLKGNLSPNALKLSFGCVDGHGVKQEIYSEASPNEIGIWRVSLSFTIPSCIKGAWITFVVGTEDEEDIVTISDINITKTDGEVAPFGKTYTDVKTPYYDHIDETQCVREYMDNMKLCLSDYIDYLQFARENGYDFDIKQSCQMVSDNDIYQFVSDLFINDTINEQDVLINVLESSDDDVKTKIAEKLILLKEFDLVEKLFENNKLSANNFLMKLIKVNLLVKNKLNEEAKKLFYQANHEVGKVKIYSYSFEADELYEIVSPFSQNRIVQRYSSAKWLLKNLPEITRRAKLLSESEAIKESSKPVWVYWAQGIENAPEVVKVCVAKMKKLFGNRLHILSDDNIRYYVSAYYTDIISNYAHRSDYIRTELLYRYGGTWIDSTVLVKEEFKDIIDNNEFVVAAYLSSNTQMGNWLMSISEKKSWIYSLLYSALTMYISSFGDFNEYLMFHTFWRILVTIDSRARKCWETVYRINGTKARKIQTYRSNGLLGVLNDEEFKKIYNDSPVLKLSHKYDIEQVKINSNIARLIRGYD